MSAPLPPLLVVDDEKNIVVTLETDYVKPFGNLDAFDYVSVGWGVQYRF